MEPPIDDKQQRPDEPQPQLTLTRRLLGDRVAEAADADLVEDFRTSFHPEIGPGDVRLYSLMEERARQKLEQKTADSRLKPLRQLKGEELLGIPDEELLKDARSTFDLGDDVDDDSLVSLLNTRAQQRLQASAPPAPAGDSPTSPPDPFISEVQGQLAQYQAENPFFTRMLQRLTSGFKGMQQGASAGVAQNNAFVLQALDAIEAGATPEELQQLDPSRYHITSSLMNLPESRRRELREQATVNLAREAGQIQQLGAEIQAIPRNPVAEKVVASKTFGEAWNHFLQDPLGVISQVGLESLPRSAPGMAGAALTTFATRNPAAGAAVMGAGSGHAEFGAGIIEGLHNAGVDPSDPAAIMAALQDPEISKQVREYARARAGIVGTFDAASGGVASKTIAPRALSSRLAKEAVNIPVQSLSQGLLGAGGEATAQLATEGEIKPGDVVAEFLGELFGAPGEVASMSAGEARSRIKNHVAENREAELAARLDEVLQDDAALAAFQQDPNGFMEAFLEGEVQRGDASEAFKGRVQFGTEEEVDTDVDGDDGAPAGPRGPNQPPSEPPGGAPGGIEGPSTTDTGATDRPSEGRSERPTARWDFETTFPQPSEAALRELPEEMVPRDPEQNAAFQSEIRNQTSAQLQGAHLANEEIRELTGQLEQTTNERTRKRIENRIKRLRESRDADLRRYQDALEQYEGIYGPEAAETLDQLNRQAAGLDQPPPNATLGGRQPTEDMSSAPIRPPNDRWTGDRGAQPGEPFLTLDDNKAAIIEQPTDDGKVWYEARADGGELIGRFETVDQAAAAAEQFVDEADQAKQQPLQPEGTEANFVRNLTGEPIRRLRQMFDRAIEEGDRRKAVFIIQEYERRDFDVSDLRELLPAEQRTNQPADEPDSSTPPSTRREGDPDVGDELGGGTVTRVWRTATANDPTGKIHVTIERPDGRGTTFVGREVDQLLQRSAEAATDTAPADDGELHEAGQKAIEQMERHLARGRGDATQVGWKGERGDPQPSIDAVEAELERRGWTPKMDGKLRVFQKDGHTVFVASQGAGSSPILQYRPSTARTDEILDWAAKQPATSEAKQILERGRREIEQSVGPGGRQANLSSEKQADFVQRERYLLSLKLSELYADREQQQPDVDAERQADLESMDAAIERMRERIEARGENPEENERFQRFVAKRDAVAAGEPYTKTDVTEDLIRQVAGMIPGTNKRADGEGLTDKAKQIQKRSAADVARGDTRVGTLTHGELNVDPDRFQPRSAAFSEESAARLANNFDERKLDPLRVWQDPDDGKWYVLAGHSRHEGIRRLIEAGELPADFAIPVDPFEGTEQEAIDFAATENDKGTGMQPWEQAEYVRGLIEADETKKDIKAKADELYGKNANTIIYLAYLSPRGHALQALRQFGGTDSKEARDALTMASWVGHIMSFHPELTRSHENEIYDHLLDAYGKRDFARSQANFRQYVEDVIGRRSFMGDFDPSEPLNFQNIKPKSRSESAIDEQLQEAERELREAKRELDRERKKYIERGAEGEQLERAIKPFTDSVTYHQRKLLQLQQEAQDATATIRRSEASLFDDLKAEGATDEQIEKAGQADADTVQRAEDAASRAESVASDPTASPDEIEQAAQELEDALEALSGARPRLIGLSVTDEIDSGAAATLIGREITDVHQLAEIAQVLRNPRYETLRWIFVKDGKIVSLQGVSSRAVNSSAAYPAGETGYWLVRLLNEIEPDQVYVLHNHPSGSPNPSAEDRANTKKMMAPLLGDKFAGHVVINSGHYAIIDREGKATMHELPDGFEDTIHVPSIDHPLLNEQLNTWEDAAAVGKRLANKPGWVTLIGGSNAPDGGLRIRGLMEVPIELLLHEKRGAATIRSFASQTGSLTVFVAGVETKDAASEEGKRAIENAIQAGFVTDVILKGGATYIADVNPQVRGQGKSPAAIRSLPPRLLEDYRLTDEDAPAPSSKPSAASKAKGKRTFKKKAADDAIEQLKKGLLGGDDAVKESIEAFGEAVPPERPTMTIENWRDHPEGEKVIRAAQSAVQTAVRLRDHLDPDLRADLEIMLRMAGMDGLAELLTDLVPVNNFDVEEDTAVYRGKPFWSGAVNLLDGEIEEVHTYAEAEAADFHHSLYFSPAAVEKMDDIFDDGADAWAFFWIDDAGEPQILWRTSPPRWIIGRIREQITPIDNFNVREIDPQLMQAGLTLAGAIIEDGNAFYPDYVSEMQKRLTKAGGFELYRRAAPYLRTWYEAVRHYPGFDNSQMTNTRLLDEAGPNAEYSDTLERERRRLEATERLGKKIDPQLTSEDDIAEQISSKFDDVGDVNLRAYVHDEDWRRSVEAIHAIERKLGELGATPQDPFRSRTNRPSPQPTSELEAEAGALQDLRGRILADLAVLGRNNRFIERGQERDGSAKHVATRMHSLRENIAHAAELTGEELQVPSRPVPAVDVIRRRQQERRAGAGSLFDQPEEEGDIEPTATDQEDSDALPRRRELERDRPTTASDAVGGDDAEPRRGGVLPDRAPDGEPDEGAPGVDQDDRGLRQGLSASQRARGDNELDQPAAGRDADGAAGEGARDPRRQRGGRADEQRGRPERGPGEAATGHPPGAARKTIPKTLESSSRGSGDARRDELQSRLKKQREADSEKVVNLSLSNIRKTLPLLFPEQQEDVYKAEQRFFGTNRGEGPSAGKGILFTNATGTGKTYTGLGIIKRFHRRGAENILIVVPTDTKAKDWIEDAQRLNLNVRQLADTKDGADGGLLVTTYANMRQNEELLKPLFDLVVFDESHKLLQSQDGDTTAGQERGMMLANQKIYGVQRLQKADPEWLALQERIDDRARRIQMTGHEQTWDGARRKATLEMMGQIEPLKKKLDEKAAANNEHTRVVFLSATPFAYHKSLRYADGILFDFPESEGFSGYNQAAGEDEFFVRNFGYRMRTNQLTQPEADVDVSLMEREFHEKLKREGVVVGRRLEVDRDYSREFVMLPSGVGDKIDDGIAFLREHREEYPLLERSFAKRWTYLYRAQLLESIKAREALERIEDHLKEGRKVVVFHNYKTQRPAHPFRQPSPSPKLDLSASEVDEYSEQYARFAAARPDLVNLDLDNLTNPIDTILGHFGDRARAFNGDVNNTDRQEAVSSFNDRDSGVDVIVTQLDAGKEGISLHDVEGDVPRVIINLGLPIKPTDAIQAEGRIYRLGVESDAILEYPVVGTSFERWTFGSKIAERSRTAENLAMGDRARDLERAFRDGYLNAASIDPSEMTGTGGKEADRAVDSMTDFDRAKTYYFARQKRDQRSKSREGNDYFATPEPLGLKMIEWLDLKPGEAFLEPSAGHGAIARFAPGNTRNTAVEPSYHLQAELQLNAGEVDIRPHRFEDLHLVNKYDGIAMNPPFGTAGKTAEEHIRKAFKHLRNGGRIVAIVPQGPAMDKRIEKMLDDVDELYIVGDLELPSVTFERAGTSVRARVLVIDRQADPDDAAELTGGSRKMQVRGENINDFFDAIEHMTMPDRVEPSEPEAPPAEQFLNDQGIEVTQTTTKKGNPVYEVTGETYRWREVLRELGGKWYRPKQAWSFYGSEDPSERIAEHIARQLEEDAGNEVREDFPMFLSFDPWVDDVIKLGRERGFDLLQAPREVWTELRRLHARGVSAEIAAEDIELMLPHSQSPRVGSRLTPRNEVREQEEQFGGRRSASQLLRTSRESEATPARRRASELLKAPARVDFTEARAAGGVREEPPGFGAVRSVWAGQPPATKKGRKLVRAIEDDHDGEKVGVRSIVEMVNEAVFAELRVGREQTTKRHPAHYEGSPHLIRSRSGGAGSWNFHEAGHALHFRLEDDLGDILDALSEELIEVANMDGSMASAESAKEGFADLVRRYITDLASIEDLPITQRFEALLREYDPELLATLQDAQRAWVAHRNRLPEARFRSFGSDEPPKPRWWKELGSVVDDIIFYGVARRHAIERIKRGIYKAAKQYSDNKRQTLKELRDFFQEIGGTTGDVSGAYQSLLKIPLETARSLHQKGGGVRVVMWDEFKFSSEILEVLANTFGPQMIERFDGVGHGDYAQLTDRSISDIVVAVGAKRWEEFDNYVRMKVSLDRFEKKRLDFTGIASQETPDDLAAGVEYYEEKYPHFIEQLEALQEYFDALLLASVAGGTISWQSAVKMKNAYEWYAPMHRMWERLGVGQDPRAFGGPEVNPKYYRARGSDRAARPLLQVIEQRTSEIYRAYYTNRMMRSIPQLQTKISSNKALPFEVRKTAERTMVRLKMDTKKLTSLSKGEAQKVIAQFLTMERVRERLAQLRAESEEAGLESEFYGLDKASPEDLVAMGVISPEDVVDPSDVELVWNGMPIFRKTKPNAIHVVAPLVAGQPRFYQIEDPILFQLFAKSDEPGKALQFIYDLGMGMTRPWKRILTRNLLFALRNVPRDAALAMFNGAPAEYLGKATMSSNVASLVPGFYVAVGLVKRLTGKTPKEIPTGELLSRSYQSTTSAAHKARVSKFRAMLEDGIVVEGFKDLPITRKVANIPGIVLSTMLKPVELLAYGAGGFLSEVTEEATRVGAYTQMKAAGATDEEAQVGFDTISGNFGDRPASTWASSVYRMAGFVNPGFQITYSIFNQLAHYDPAVRRRAWMRLGWVALPTAFAWAVNAFVTPEDVEDELKERTDDERLNTMAIYIPGLGVTRVPFDYGVIGAVQSFTWNMLEEQAGQGFPDRQKLALNMIGRILDIPGDPAAFLQPQIKTLLENKINYRFYFDQPIVPGWMENLPPAEQVFHNTPEIYREIGAALGVSPLKVQHFIRGALAYQVDELARTIEGLDRGDPEVLSKESPLIGRLFTNEPIGWQSKSVHTVDELGSEYLALRRQLQARIERGDTDNVEQLAERMAEYDRYHEAMLAVADLWRTAKELRDAGLDDEVVEVQREMTRVARLLLPPELRPGTRRDEVIPPTGTGAP